MYRFVQGDVGSGKTVVAAISLYANYLAGYLNTKHYCRMDNKARNNFQLIRQNNVNEAG